MEVYQRNSWTWKRTHYNDQNFLQKLTYKVKQKSLENLNFIKIF